MFRPCSDTVSFAVLMTLVDAIAGIPAAFDCSFLVSHMSRRFVYCRHALWCNSVLTTCQATAEDGPRKTVEQCPLVGTVVVIHGNPFPNQR